MWLVWPTRAEYALRIDMLSVGDGSCFVIRTGGFTVVFDAGSSTDLNVARRSLIPAMRRFGIRSVDAIIVSHADFDHYSAVVDLAAEFDIDQLLLTPQFMDEVEADPRGSAAYMMEQLNEMRVASHVMASGATRAFGGTQWTWLHPHPDKAFRRGNDASTVLRIECAGRRVLMCGDIQREAISQLLHDHDVNDIRADIIELPHHGSFNEAAVDFIAAADPKVVMQSTGWARWQRDRWAAALSGRERLVTARDGACWIEISVTSEITTGRFLQAAFD